MDKFTEEEEELDTIEESGSEGDYVLMPSHPDYNKGVDKKPEAKAPEVSIQEVDGGWEITGGVDTIDEPGVVAPKSKAPQPHVTGSVTLQAPPTPTEEEEEAVPTRGVEPAPFQPGEAFRSLKPVSEEYSGHLDELDGEELRIKSMLSRRTANILANVPKRLQERYLQRERAQAAEVASELELQREQLGGEIYSKLDDDTRISADQLREAGLSGIHAAKVAERHSKVEKLAGSILTEAEGDPRVHNALVEKLYGVPQRDSRTGEVEKDETGQPIRLGGLIKKTQYGTMDVTNEAKFERLVAEAKASEDYRNDKATMRMREAGRGSRGSSSGSESLETPRLKALRGQASDVMGTINFLKGDEGDDTYKASSEYRQAADQLRAIQSHISQEANLINARDNAERERMGYPPLDTLPDQNAPTIQKNKEKKEVYDVQAQNSRLTAVVNKAAAGQNDADARTKVNAAKEKFAKDEGLKIAKPTSNLDLVTQLSRMGDKPQMFLFEGKVGAGTGLQAGVMDRGAVVDWAKNYAKIEKKQEFEKKIAQSERVLPELRKQVSRYIPDVEFDASGFIETRNYGPNARLVANYNQAINDARVAGDELKAIQLAHRIATGKLDAEEVQEPTSEFNEDRYNGSGEDKSPSVWSRTKSGF